MITLFILVNFKNEDDNLRKDIYLAFLVISLMVVAGCNVFETIYGTTSAGNLTNTSSSAAGTLNIETNFSSSGVEPAPKSGAVFILSETGTVKLKPKAADPDNDDLVFTYTSPLNEEGEWQTTYGDEGQYTITITVSDGKLTDSMDVLLIINKKEEPPVIEKVSPIQIAVFLDENDEQGFFVDAIDINKDILTYIWKLDGEIISEDSKYDYKTTYDDAGSHTVKVDVSDGKGSASRLWSVTVNNVNRAPSLDNLEDLVYRENDKILITLSAHDDDGDAITYLVDDPRFGKLSDK